MVLSHFDRCLFQFSKIWPAGFWALFIDPKCENLGINKSAFFFFFEKVSTIAISIGKGRLDPRLEWTIQTTIFLFFLLTKNKRKKIEVMYTFFILFYFIKS